MIHSESSGSEVHAIILLVLILVAVALRRLGENHLARCGMGKVYPLVMSKQLLKITIEIVDLPIKNSDFPVRKLLVYQRVICLYFS